MRYRLKCVFHSWGPFKTISRFKKKKKLVWISQVDSLIIDAELLQKKMKLADDRKIKVEPLVKNTDVIVLSHLSHGKIQGMLTWHPFSVLAFPRSRSGLWITCDVKTQVLHCYCLRLRLLFTFSTPHNTIRTALNPLCETF